MSAGTVPDIINVRYARHGETDLWCAISDDLPGLIVMGPEVDDVREDLLLMAAEIVRERFGKDVSYTWEEDDFPAGFIPLDRMARESVPA